MQRTTTCSLALVAVIALGLVANGQGTTLEYDGLTHLPLGTATLSVDPPTHELIVGNIGSSGQDGVAVVLSEFDGLRVHMPVMPPVMPIGSSMVSRYFGPEGPVIVQAGELVTTRTPNGISFAPSWPPSSLGTPTTGTIRIYDSNLLVHEVSGVAGGGPELENPPPIFRVRVDCDWQRRRWTITIDHRGPMLSQGATFHGTRIEFESDDPTVGPSLITEAQMVAQDLPAIVVSSEKVQFQDFHFAAHGAATFFGYTGSDGQRRLEVRNLGSSGEDGVSVDLGLSSDASVSWDPLSSPPGALSSLVVSSSGIVAGDDQELGSVACAQQPTGSVRCTPDYSPISATSVRVEVWSQGTMMLSLPGLVDPVIESDGDELPFRCGKLNNWPVLCLWFEWLTQRTFNINGLVVTVGDEIRMIAENSVEVTTLTGFSFSTVAITEMAFTAVTSVPYDIPPITDIAATLDTDGDVTLSWTSPIVYSGMEVYVDDVHFATLDGSVEEIDLGDTPSTARITITICLCRGCCITIIIDLGVILPPPTPAYSRGDANGDMSLNIGDAIFLLSYAFSEGTAPGCLSSADSNDDGAFNIADVISILSYLFSGGAALAPPFPGCGPDTTPDTLGCLSFTGCAP
ncbi:MAG: hypothetical protein ACKVX7_04595 [Planctomycetota bacterium]